MNITKLAMVLLVLVFASVQAAFAEGERVSSSTALSSSSTGDCDDSDAACKPAADMTAGGDATVSADAMSSSTAASPASSGLSGGVDEDCDGDACVSPPVTAEPSGMAINEKGLPGDKKPKSTK